MLRDLTGKPPGRPKRADILPPPRPDFEGLALREEIAGRDTSLFPGVVEISIPMRDEIVEYVRYLERHVDPKRLQPPPLSPSQQQVVALEVQAWAAPNRIMPSGYVPWNGLKPHLPLDLYGGDAEGSKEDAFKRTLTNWRRQPAYRAAFIRGCSAALAAHMDERTKEKK